ncbi:MAG: CDP-glucose 4,6-dehydratase [Sedimentisphaerales bacterium]|nr:CDP-glucose 4,6-dehydratase [Sedimentisphaerales bacterium]
MEKMVTEDFFHGIYKGLKVLLTGHTGFKGSWLGIWLNSMGAKVCGYSLAPEEFPNHFELINEKYSSVIGNILDAEKLCLTLQKHQPEIVFHLAAQPLVRYSYLEPVETFQTNVLGLVNLLEACRKLDSLKAIVIITTDKCYKDQKWQKGYKESDQLGGFDPYSSSKACAELVIDCYRQSFFNPSEYGKNHMVLMASARAGNVIGGGDWSKDRIIPDIVRAASQGKKTLIRNPASIRAWQHVLEPLSGYLMLGQKLLEGEKEFAQAWNFGPLNGGVYSVEQLAAVFSESWPKADFEFKRDNNEIHETHILRLDCSKAHNNLGWVPVWNDPEGIKATAQWYKAYYEDGLILTEKQLDKYFDDAITRKVKWAI